VETTKQRENESMILPLPWGDLDNVAVKYHVVHERTLPTRPRLCTHEQWALVTRMCVNDQTRRLKISTVVDELERLMVEKGLKGKSPKGCDTATPTPITGIIASLKICDDSARSSSLAGQEAQSMIFSLLWQRLEHLSTTIANDDGDVESLRELAEKARVETLVLADSSDTLVEFTQTAMCGYALHRKLDKLIEANSWRTDGGEVHDWKSRCNELLRPTNRESVTTFEPGGVIP
jgi:hypothetical protein